MHVAAKEALTRARVTVRGRSGARVSLSGRRSHVGRLDDEGLLMIRQRLDVPPHSQPAGHAGKVGSLKNKWTKCSGHAVVREIVNRKEELKCILHNKHS